MTEPRWKSARQRRALQSIAGARRTTVVCAALLAQACGGDNVNAPSPATLSGTVVLQDAWGNPFDDLSGVDVAVSGASAHATTDRSGAWHIDGVPSGFHDVSFSKATFATMHIPAQSVTSPSTTTAPVTLGQAPWQQAVIDSIHIVTQSGRDSYVADGHLSAPPPSNALVGITVVVVGKTVAVSSDPASFLVWGSGINPGSKASTFSISLPASTLSSNFASGASAFVTAFAASACGCYTDVATQRPVFSSVGPRANVLSVTIK